MIDTVYFKQHVLTQPWLPKVLIPHIKTISIDITTYCNTMELMYKQYQKQLLPSTIFEQFISANRLVLYCNTQEYNQFVYHQDCHVTWLFENLPQSIKDVQLNQVTNDKKSTTDVINLIRMWKSNSQQPYSLHVKTIFTPTTGNQKQFTLEAHYFISKKECIFVGDFDQYLSVPFHESTFIRTMARFSDLYFNKIHTCFPQLQRLEMVSNEGRIRSDLCFPQVGIDLSPKLTYISYRTRSILAGRPARSIVRNGTTIECSSCTLSDDTFDKIFRDSPYGTIAQIKNRFF